MVGLHGKHALDGGDVLIEYKGEVDLVDEVRGGFVIEAVDDGGHGLARGLRDGRRGGGSSGVGGSRGHGEASRRVCGGLAPRRGGVGWCK